MSIAYIDIEVSWYSLNIEHSTWSPSLRLEKESHLDWI